MLFKLEKRVFDFLFLHYFFTNFYFIFINESVTSLKKIAVIVISKIIENLNLKSLIHEN